MKSEFMRARITQAGAALAMTWAWVMVPQVQAYQPYMPSPSPGHHPCSKAHAYGKHLLADQMRVEWESEYDAQVKAGLREALEDSDVLHCNLEIEVIPGATDNLFGTNVITVESRVDGLTQFTFRLRSQFIIDSITVNGNAPGGISTPSATTRVVTLDQTYNTGETFEVSIQYHGHAESRGFGSIEFTTHSSQNIVYSLSEAYYAYTWWPCKDGDFGEPGDNGDKFTLDLAVIAPDTMVSASNGVLQGVDALSGSRSRYRWSTNYPISTYLVCFSSTNYNQWMENYVPIGGGLMPVLFYIYPEHDTTGNRAAWSEVVDMMYTMRDLYGEYPFVNEKYGIYECQFSGGMEHQTFTAQGTFSEQVTIHELGHQWFGDKITCKTWNHIWLNEGFASYTEALWAEFQPGSSGLPALKSIMNTKKYVGTGSVYVTDAEVTSMGAIFDGNTTYDKGAWVVHMLRHVLGEADFFDMLAAYQAAFEFQAATTEDLQAVAETFYAGSLDWFFQQWVYGELRPEYTWGWDAVSVNGKDYLLVSIDQTHDIAYQRFTMPIDIVTDTGTHVVFNDADPEYFVVPVSGTPATADLDPDAWVLRKVVNSSYVSGPPVIVETSPAPGEAIDEGAGVNTLTIWHQTNVDTAELNYTLVGDTTGVQSFTISDTSDVNPVILNLGAALAADTYTLTVSDSVTAVNSGLSLDGEVAIATEAGSLPSGDGEPAGSAVIQFSITGSPLPGDLDGDGDVDLVDFLTFAGCFAGSGTTPHAGCSATEFADSDMDGDNDVDLNDFLTFSGNLTG